MKPVEIVLRRWERGRGRKMEGVNPTKIYFKHTCSWAPVDYTYNPSYSGGRDQEDCCSKPVQANSS
jgi:hypothetical protein